MAIPSATNWHNIFETCVNAWVSESRLDIKKAVIWTDFANDYIDLGITYRLFSYHDLQISKPYEIQEKFARKVHEILQTKKKTPKQITVERRRMLWRGEYARKAKVKKK